MHQFILKSSIAGLSLLAFGTAHAQSAQSAAVDFTGSISPVTCTVSTATRNPKVNFGPVPPTNTGFTGGGGAVGNVALPAYEKSINITLEGCSTPGGPANHPSTVLVRVTGPVNAEGRLSTTNRTADIQLLEHGSSTDVWDLNNAARSVPLSTAPVNLRFISRYYVAAVPLSTGAANANAVFTMDYR